MTLKAKQTHEIVQVGVHLLLLFLPLIMNLVDVSFKIS